MDTALNDTQRLLRESVRDYLEKEVPFDRIRTLERDGGADTDLWSHLADSGYLGLPFPESVGGGGGELSDLAVVLEELTRRAVVIPFMETMACGVAIQRFADESVSRPFIDAIVAGRMTISPAIQEADASPESFAMTVADGRITGAKRFVDYGQDVSHHLVAVMDGDAPALVLVETADPGVSLSPLDNIGRTPQAHATYTDANRTAVAGEQAVTFLMRTLRSLAAIQCVGNSQQALDATVEYVSMRVQFGRPIGTFQAVQHHCADMATMTLGARFLAYEALWNLDHGQADDRAIARAKAWASKTATEVPMLAHQLHGGIGYTEEYDLHFFSRRGKERALAWGSSEECLGYLADTIAEEPAWR